MLPAIHLVLRLNWSWVLDMCRPIWSSGYGIPAFHLGGPGSIPGVRTRVDLVRLLPAVRTRRPSRVASGGGSGRSYYIVYYIVLYRNF